MKRTFNAIPQNVLDSILLAHRFTGCDTVSTIFRIGKTSIIKKNIITEEIAITFHSHESSSEKIIQAGEALMMKLYSNPGYSTINKMRLKVYKRKLGDIKIQIKEKSAALFHYPLHQVL